MLSLSLALTMLSAACAMGHSEPPIVRIAACPTLVQYSSDQLKALDAQLAAIPENTPVWAFISDYKRMRAQIRDCLKQQP